MTAPHTVQRRALCRWYREQLLGHTLASFAADEPHEALVFAVMVAIRIAEITDPSGSGADAHTLSSPTTKKNNRRQNE